MDEYLSVAEAARLLGVVPATVRQMERSGRLPALRTEGGVRFFRKVVVEQLVEERRGPVVDAASASLNEEEAR